MPISDAFPTLPCNLMILSFAPMAHNAPIQQRIRIGSASLADLEARPSSPDAERTQRLSRLSFLLWSFYDYDGSSRRHISARHSSTTRERIAHSVLYLFGLRLSVDGRLLVDSASSCTEEGHPFFLVGLLPSVAEVIPLHIYFPSHPSGG